MLGTEGVEIHKNNGTGQSLSVPNGKYLFCVVVLYRGPQHKSS